MRAQGGGPPSSWSATRPPGTDERATAAASAGDPPPTAWEDLAAPSKPELPRTAPTPDLAAGEGYPHRRLPHIAAGIALGLAVLVILVGAGPAGSGAAAARAAMTAGATERASVTGTAWWSALGLPAGRVEVPDEPVELAPPDAVVRALDQPDLPLPALRMARFGDLVLRVPTRDPVLIGFHEAATANGLELEPIGTLRVNRNATRFTPPEDDPVGPSYLIMASRGRTAGATTAIDIAMVDDDPVLAPVSGVVTDVRSYQLYGEHPDQRVEIAPDDDADLKVVVVHVSDVTVGVGERVRAGRTVIAGTATRFPFLSQIDNDTLPEVWPHVHIEVQPADARRPGDPWPDAEPGDD